MGAGAEPVVELGPGLRQPLPGSRPRTLERAEPQPDLAALGNAAGAAREARRRAGAAQPHQLRLPPAARVPAKPTRPGRPRTPASCGRGRWPTSRPSSACTSRSPSTRAASACWPATTSRARPTSACRSSASACSTARATSASGSTATAGSARSTSSSDTNQLPMEPAIGANGEPVTVQLDTRGGVIAAKVWRVRVGRCDLLLLDSNVEGNSPEDRELTARLYGGDARVRIRQELLLGVGGYRALRAMGITPWVLHLNEGHSGFAVLEAIRSRMIEEGIGFHQARVARGPRGGLHHAHAGAGRPRPLPREPHRGAPRAAARSARHLARTSSMALGRENPDNPHEEFCMTVLGLKLSRRANAVSALHGEVSRAMWTGLYPGRERGSGADRPHHQRRARADVAGAADVAALRPPPRARLAQQQRRGRASGKASRASTTASCGKPT